MPFACVGAAPRWALTKAAILLSRGNRAITPHGRQHNRQRIFNTNKATDQVKNWLVAIEYIATETLGNHVAAILCGLRILPSRHFRPVECGKFQRRQRLFNVQASVKALWQKSALAGHDARLPDSFQ